MSELFKKNFILVSFSLLVFFIACTPIAKSNPKKKNIQSINTQLCELHVALHNSSSATIYYQRPEWKRSAHQIEYVLHGALTNVLKYLTPRPGLNTSIILLDQALFASHVTSAHWAIAAYHGGRIFVPIKNNQLPSLKTLKTTITHEYMHAIVDDLSNTRAPAWIDEGLALLAENNKRSSSKAAFYNHFREHGLVPFSQMDKSFTLIDSDLTSVAYIQAMLATQYLIETYPNKPIEQFLLTLGFSPKREPSILFTTFFGIDEINFSNKFENHLRKNGHGKRLPKFSPVR